jgi:beta-aspartyl-dipeptidase (metallo-type)
LLNLLTNAQVFGPEALGLRHLLVGGGRILAMCNDPDDVSAPGIRVTDLDGKRLVPGFIDCHAHVTGGGGESGFKTQVPPVPPGQFTTAGVTSVVGVLGTDDTTRDTRALLARTHALREEGLGAWCHTGGYHVPPVTLTGSVRDDIVFLDPIIGVGELALSDHRSSQPTCDELLRIASDAHVAGMAFPVDDDEDAWAADLALIRYLESGAPADRVTVSSDGGGCLPVFNEQGEMTEMGIGSPSCLGETLQALLAKGVELESALPAFTSNVANLLRLADRGRIRIGAVADLLVLDDEGGIDSVMAAGVWHVQSGTRQVFGRFETRADQ